MSRETVCIIVFFFLLVIGFYYSMARRVPGFGKSKLAPIGGVLPFAFTNQVGKIVAEQDVAGTVFVAEYFFTTCKSICPIMYANMKSVYERFKNENGFLIVSHTSDPSTDSAARLKKYADSMNVDTKKWIFLTGTKDSLYRQARHSYKIDDPNNNPLNNEVDFLHSQYFSLVDKNGNVRNIFEGNERKDVERMINEIVVLLKEK